MVFRDDDPQGSLPFGWDEKGLAGSLSALTGAPVSVSITSNRASVLSMRRGPGRISLRLHRIFLTAGAEVVSEIARFIKNRKKGERFPAISRYIRENIRHIRNESAENARRRAKTKIPLNAAGRFHDLSAMCASVNEEYFGGGPYPEIGWGKMSGGKKRAVRKRTLGSYIPPGERPKDGPPEDGGRGIIRINLVLDKKGVPACYVRFVVYHELLHAHLGITVKNGRRQVHPPEFRRRERLFREYQKAMAWEKRKNF